MSNTPIAHAAAHNMGSVAEPHYVVDIQVAQILEHKLAEAQAEIVRLTKRKDECSNGWDGALATVQRIERELAEAKKDAERYRYVRSIWGLPDEKFNDEIDAAMKGCGK